MLKQLLKYEFKATGRTYGGLYLALVALAVLSGFSLRSSSKDNFASLLLFAYMVVAVAVAVVSVMTIVTRFTRNLLGREGYLMHTLPVTESQLILSKLISSVVWMLCSSIVGIFSFAVMLLALSLNSAALHRLPEGRLRPGPRHELPPGRHLSRAPRREQLHAVRRHPGLL